MCGSYNKSITLHIFLLLLSTLLAFSFSCNRSPDTSGNTTAPLITDLAAINITTDGAEITWTTSEVATSQVFYDTVSHTDANDYEWHTTLDTTLESSHSVVLDGLDPATAYHFRVISEDAAGNKRTSGDQTFTTTSLEIPSSGIAFLSDMDGDTEIYVMSTDGTNIFRLTDNDRVESHPTWSPDGTKIVYKYQKEIHRETEYSLSIVDTNELIEIDINPLNMAAVNDPVWSPDSSKIIYKGRRLGVGLPPEDIYMVNADGTNNTLIAYYNEDNEYEFVPVWSPDGSNIAFLSDYHDIYVMDTDGSNILQLTDSQDSENYLTWAPDSSKILFVSSWDNHKICEINADGSNLNVLAEFDWIGGMESLVWSPDFTKIAFVVIKRLSPIPEDYRREYYIYVMNIDGSNRTIMEIKTDGRISWSPDSNMITYSSDGDIWIVNADGTGLTNLTNSPNNDSFPVWSP